MKAEDIDKAKNPLLGLALPALKRAAKNARDLAIFHNTKIIIWRNNRIVRLSADEIRAQKGDG